MRYLSSGLAVRDQLIAYMQSVDLTRVDWAAWWMAMGIVVWLGWLAAGWADRRDERRRGRRDRRS